jgi:hypothetical protein
MANQPQNLNFLSPLGAKFEIKRLPTINFFVQAVSLPSVTMGEVEIPTPFTKLKKPGDQLMFGDLVVQFRVDEDLENYREMYNWMRSITRVDNFEESTAWVNESSPMSDERVYSDGTLTVMNSAMNPNLVCEFTNMYPSTISELPFMTTQSDVDYIEATITFKFQKFDIIKL